MADGYHRIETIFAFCADGDRLTVQADRVLGIDVSGEFAGALGEEHDNLALRAAIALAGRFEVTEGARLRLEKLLPVAAGLGGGSADAAAALRLLRRFWRLEAPEAALLEFGARLGADVPACLVSRTMRGEGRGDVLTPLELPDLAGMPVLLVNPGTSLSTAEVYVRWDGIDRGPLDKDWRAGRNDLQPIAEMLVPEIREILAALADAEIARMSGSGPTCFGLYGSESERDLAASRISTAHPEWWVLATRLR